MYFDITRENTGDQQMTVAKERLLRLWRVVKHKESGAAQMALAFLSSSISSSE
jgi:hypothetical protein